MHVRAAISTVALLLAPVIARADVVTQWNEKAIASATAGGQNPLIVSQTVAIVHTAMFDAKYAFNFWRPITAIRNGDIDGNDATSLDAGWEPLIDTPPHPEYPCAHCITSAAVATILNAEFGAEAISKVTMTSSTAPGVVRKWTSTKEYVDEVSAARIYGGVHYRTSATVAQDMGRKIAELTLRERMQPLR